VHWEDGVNTGWGGWRRQRFGRIEEEGGEDRIDKWWGNWSRHSVWGGGDGVDTGLGECDQRAGRME
jgi:hypothetical protein